MSRFIRPQNIDGYAKCACLNPCCIESGVNALKCILGPREHLELSGIHYSLAYIKVAGPTVLDHFSSFFFFFFSNVSYANEYVHMMYTRSLSKANATQIL